MNSVQVLLLAQKLLSCCPSESFLTKVQTATFGPLPSFGSCPIAITETFGQCSFKKCDTLSGPGGSRWAGVVFASWNHSTMVFITTSSQTVACGLANSGAWHVVLVSDGFTFGRQSDLMPFIWESISEKIGLSTGSASGDVSGLLRGLRSSTRRFVVKPLRQQSGSLST